MTSTLRVLQTYRAVTSRLTASDIADPLPIVHPNETFEHVFESEFWREIALVRDETNIYGYIDLTDPPENPDTSAGMIAKPIPADQIVPAETPLLDLVQLFPQHFFFFLLTRNELVGLVSYIYVDRHPVKLCLFALMLELEATISQRLTGDRYISKANYYLSLLRPARIEKAKELARQKGLKGGPFDLLECTTLIDKTKMILNSELAPTLKTVSGEESAEGFLSRVEKVRNEIAHGGSVLKFLPKPTDLVAFTEQLQRMISILGSESDDL